MPPPVFKLRNKAVIVGGLDMVPTDGDSYWEIADDLRTLGIEPVCVAWNKLSDIHMFGCNLLYAYSYGGAASVNRRTITLKKMLPLSRIAKALLVAAVPNIPDYGQGGVYADGGWTLDDHISQAVCLQVTSIPQSMPLKGAPEIRLVADGSVVPDLTLPRLNINCDVVEDGIMPDDRHRWIKNSLVVKSMARKMAEIYVAACAQRRETLSK